MRDKVKVEVLYVEGCPSQADAVNLVREILTAHGVSVEVQQVVVKDEGMARELEFTGSPTIRINGLDVAGHAETSRSFALSCRIYPNSRQVGLPPAELVRRAILKASEGHGS